MNTYFKIAWRNLMNNKIFSFINIFGLSAGLASCMLICLYVFDEMSYDTARPNGNNTYQVGSVLIRPDGELKLPSTPARLVEAMRQDFPEVVNTTRIASLFTDDKTLLTFKDKFLGESLLLSTLAFAFSMAIIGLLTPVFSEITDKKFAFTPPSVFWAFWRVFRA
jgi:putative ABC transport system permease protein